ncbi:lambda exonuclease family protein [Psychrobacter glacincola]|uniref:lambda exonuclease family protein n=1 Tax=Psychrobacter glacincola TaxID=56810 RepID=UPI0039AE997A
MNLLQRHDEWLSDRVGKITASRVKDISAKPRKGKALNATMTTLLTERLTGEIEDRRISDAMQWGIDNEPNAIAAYENATGEFVVGCGLITHPAISMSGASPDGLIGDDGLIEVKCPNRDTHTNTILTQQVPEEYMPQITWQLACTGRKWCDFVSYDPRFSEDLQTIIIRVMRDDVDIEALENEVAACNAKLNEIIENLTKTKEGETV